jgi:hypothetical protein
MCVYVCVRVCACVCTILSLSVPLSLWGIRSPAASVVSLQVVMTEKLLTATIERGMPSDYEIVFERESEQSPVWLFCPVLLCFAVWCQ